jgi:hypothetical protein
MEVLVGYEPRVVPEYFLGSFLLFRLVLLMYE